MALEKLEGTRWRGRSELWKDPLGDIVQTCDCTMSVDDRGLHYTWSYEGRDHEGHITLGGTPSFRDSWHQPEPAGCERVDNPRSLVTLAYTYMETWGWRINICLREPTGELVVQMTNIAPWGEEARAVRMVGTRLEG